MKLNGTPNRFMTIPPITKDVWDHIQSFHPRTLALSFLRAEKKKDQLQLTFQKMMQEIHDLSSTKPLHIRIGMWHTQLSEKTKCRRFQLAIDRARQMGTVVSVTAPRARAAWPSW